MHITGMVHININCSNFQKSKVFYEMLGFKVYWPVPETNTTEDRQCGGHAQLSGRRRFDGATECPATHGD